MRPEEIQNASEAALFHILEESDREEQEWKCAATEIRVRARGKLRALLFGADIGKCPYCGQRFILDQDEQEHPEHYRHICAGCLSLVDLTQARRCYTAWAAIELQKLLIIVALPTAILLSLLYLLLK